MTAPLGKVQNSDSAFTLVEIVIALGVVAFCIVPLIGTLAVAYQQGRDSQAKTEVALVLQSMETALRASANRGTNSFADLRTKLPLTNYFAEGGRYLGANASVSGTTNFYRCVASANALQANANSFGISIVVQYPPPAYQQQVTNQISLFRYGTRW
jgi:uncharacterized protein (TIGR02598 family)